MPDDKTDFQELADLVDELTRKVQKADMPYTKFSLIDGGLTHVRKALRKRQEEIEDA